MACREKPLLNGVLPPTSPPIAGPGPSKRGPLAWYRRLPGRSGHRDRLGPLREESNAAPGPSGSSQPTSSGTQPLAKSTKASPRDKPDDRVSSRKENGETTRERREDSRLSFDKLSSKQRMSYPPCTGPSRSKDRPALSVKHAVKQALSCPVLRDLGNLPVAPKKSLSPGSCAPATAGGRLGTNGHQRKTKQDATGRHGEPDRLQVPDARTSGRQRHAHRRPRNGREEAGRNPRPRPPSWQDLLPQPTGPGSTCAPDAVATHTQAVPESIYVSSPALAGHRCDSATARSAGEPERRVVRANIRRTRSRVIDSREIPKHEAVLTLSQTKPSELHPRFTYHDDTAYLLENARRCRTWLAALEESDATPPVDGSGNYNGQAVDRDETVTCDVEISNEKWSFLGSPYPSSSECSSED